MSSEQRESTDRPKVKTSSKGQLGWIKLKVSRVIISMDDKILDYNQSTVLGRMI